MFSRILGIPLLLGAAVGVPYVATNGPDLKGLWSENSQQTDNSGNAGGRRNTFSSDGLPQGSGMPPLAGSFSEASVANVTLSEAFRFDISREWVYQRWARKSTALSKLGLYGVRVALVTGTELHDVAGSLTYLFGQDGRLQQISFHGRTGDTTQLVMLVSKRFGLQPQATVIAGEQIFQVRRNEQIFSELRTRPSSVLRTNALHDSFTVDLELQRADVSTPLRADLLPLPTAEVQSTESAAQEKSTEPTDADEEETAEKSGDEGSWKAFFPRSRVPSEQVESLDKRGRLW